MRTRSFIVIGLTLVIFLGGSGALYAYDSSRPQVIAKGITVAGIDIGGLSPAAARGRLKARYVHTVQKPIVVHHDTSSWTLGAREARIKTNIDAIIARAQARSDEGNIFQRSYRRITGGKLQMAVQPDVTFSDKAVIRMIDRVRKGVNRKPTDASLSISLAGFNKVPSRIGLAVDAKGLHRQIDQAIVSPSAKRKFVATTRHIQPKVTTQKLAAQNETVLVVNKSTYTLKLFKNLKLAKTYPVAVGQPAYPTPEGTFSVQDKQVDPVWSVPNSPWAGELAGTTVQGGTGENPLKARWIGVTDGVGFHGTSEDASVGSPASHGCMRMHVADVIDLFPRVSVGATVFISH